MFRSVCVCERERERDFPSCWNQRSHRSEAEVAQQKFDVGTQTQLANPAQSTSFMALDNRCTAYWSAVPFRRPSVLMSSYWPEPQTSPTTSYHHSNTRKEKNCLWADNLNFLCALCIFLSLTWPGNRTVSRSPWRHWRTTCCHVCPQLQGTSWAT